jgi:hypothetical protein
VRRKRLLALVAAGLVLSVFLLDWTVGALASPLSLRRQADARRVRASMQGFDDVPGLVHAPGLSLGLQGHVLKTGALGERLGDSAATVSAEGALRVLVVGDGATLGLGIEDELTFARGLERERSIDGRPVVVANGAHVFAEGPEPAALRSHWLPRFDPDVVLLCGPTVAGAPGPLFRSIGSTGSAPPGLLRRMWPWLWELDRVVGGEQHADVVSAPPPLAEEEIRERFVAAIAACRAGGAEPIVVDLGGLPPLRAWAEAAGAPVIDATPEAEVGAPVLADLQVGHLTRLGQDRVLQRLVEALVASGRLSATD